MRRVREERKDGGEDGAKISGIGNRGKEVGRTRGEENE